MNDLYPVWWETTITMYNKYEASNGEITWYRTVIEGCFWKYETEYERVGETTQMVKVLLCRVRKSADFLEDYEWQEVSDRGNYFTFNQGDILVKGEVTDTIDEYTSGHRASDLTKKYKSRCAEITEYRNNTGAGRVNEHYLVRGL